MAPEPQWLCRQRKIGRMVAFRRKSDRPAVIFMIITDGQTRYPMVTQNENPIEDRDENPIEDRENDIKTVKNMKTTSFFRSKTGLVRLCENLGQIPQASKLTNFTKEITGG